MWQGCLQACGPRRAWPHYYHYAPFCYEGTDALRAKGMKELVGSGLLLEYPSGLDVADFEQRKADFVRRDSAG